MNREIKFRMWHEGKMYPVLCLWSNGCARPELLDNLSEMSYEYRPIMQFIGLIDRDGIEIFEGDIVQFATHDGKGVVKYDAPNFEVFDGDASYSLQGYECTVIGNIYENPELLK